MSTQNGDAEKSYETKGDTTEISFSFVFDYQYDSFPDEMSVYFTADFEEKNPHISMRWITPDGREIRVASFALEKSNQAYRVSQDERLQRRLGGEYPQIGLLRAVHS